MIEVKDGNEVVSIKRLDQFKNGKQPSRAIKIDFQEKKIPSNIRVGLLSFSVTPYVAPPLRCFRCQRLGHVASGCTAIERCLVCAGDHSVGLCNSRILKCPNC